MKSVSINLDDDRSAKLQALSDSTSGHTTQVQVAGQTVDIKRSSFYELDEEPSKQYQKSNRKKSTNLQGQMKIAVAKSLSTPTAKRKRSDATKNQSTNEKYRSKKRARKK